MATGSAPEEASVSSFPTPPAVFYRLYSDENLGNGHTPKPPSPVKGKYEMFGAPFDTEEPMIRSLEDQSLDRLYPLNYDRKAELKKLNGSILVCFLELLDILIHDPSSPARNMKISDIQTLFINMHHLINEYRPHQARETLRVIMERQKKQRDDMLSQVQRATDKAKSILKECRELLAQATSPLQSSGEGAGEGVEGEGGVEDIAMDTSSTVPARAEGKGDASDDSPYSLVDRQDTELCAIIDTLIS